MAAAAKEVSRLTGTVSSFNNTKGFGFIKCNMLKDELFVHQSEIKADGFRTLKDGAVVEFSALLTDDNKYKAVNVTGPNGVELLTSGGVGRDRKCYNCDKTGHVKRDCPEVSVGGGGGGGDAGCYNCGVTGHFARDCPEPYSRPSRGGGNGGDNNCYTCKQPGHFSRDCTEKSVGGQGRKATVCRDCQEIGHIARDCPTKIGGIRIIDDVICYNCNKSGHFARDCSSPSSGAGRRFGAEKSCYNCGELGHIQRDCVAH